MHNKLNINNLNFEKNNIIEIDEIAQLKEDPYNGKKFDFSNNNEDLLIVQKNFFGPNYDLLIIKKGNAGYYSDFIQIGLDKTEQQINKIVNDLESKYYIYKNNILTAFGIKSDFISISFIFDYDTQKEKNFSDGFEICKSININFYLFSLKDCSLVELNKNKDIKILVNNYFPSFLINQNKKRVNAKRYPKKKQRK